MNSSNSTSSAITLLAIFALAVGAATANARAFSYFIEVNSTLFDECTGEDVVFTGKEHLEVNSTTNKDGSFHLHITANFARVTGIGQTTATKYHFPVELNETQNLHAGQEQTLVESMNLISEGSSSNQKIKWLIHITVDANGVVRVNNDSYEVTCTP
jgi:hypothetical protein